MWKDETFFLIDIATTETDKMSSQSYLDLSQEEWFKNNKMKKVEMMSAQFSAEFTSELSSPW